jgi:hypothetical protein
MYYVQHYAILLIPIYLAWQGGPYTLESFTQVPLSLDGQVHLVRLQMDNFHLFLHQQTNK